MVEFIQFKPKFNLNNKYVKYVTNLKLLIFKPWNTYSYSFFLIQKKKYKIKYIAYVIINL